MDYADLEDYYAAVPTTDPYSQFMNFKFILLYNIYKVKAGTPDTMPSLTTSSSGLSLQLVPPLRGSLMISVSWMASTLTG